MNTKLRFCETCPHDILGHLQADEGMCRPCCQPGCNCMNFSDKLAREAAERIAKPKGKGPMGFCH